MSGEYRRSFTLGAQDARTRPDGRHLHAEAHAGARSLLMQLYR